MDSQDAIAKPARTDDLVGFFRGNRVPGAREMR
jgi:hypothetical protein